MNHITVHRKGEATPGPLRWQDGLFLCPFCSVTHYKPTQYPQIMAHLASHKWKAIQHGDYVIYSCKLGCDGKSVHFHCCQCSRSYRNRSELLKHLKSHPTPEGQPPPPTEPPPPPGPQVRPIGPPTPLPHLKSEPPMEDQAQPQPPTETSTAIIQTPPQPRVEPATPLQPPADPPHPPPVPQVTVHRKDEATPGPLRWQDGLFLCPFCSATHYKPTQYPQIMAHLASHKWKAIQHGDYVIYSCKLGCGGKSVHFHCCQCSRSYRNRSDLLKHLKSHPTPEGQPPPPTEPPPPPGPQVRPIGPPTPLPRPPTPPTPPQPPADPSNRPPASHVTVHRKGEATPGPLRWQDGLFLCPFCSATHYKPTQYPQIMAHLASHKWKAVQHGDYVIYSCKLGCGGKSVHFHCCQCSRSYRSKSELLKHLKSHPTPEGQPPPPTEPPPAERPPTPPQSQPPVKSQTPPQPQPPVGPPTPPQLEAQPPEPRPSGKTTRKLVQCSHCGMTLRSNNIKKHTQRKHSARPPWYAVTAGHHLPSQCVDKSNGVYAVARSFMGPCVPVHVAKTTWGASPRVGCDVDRCGGRLDLERPKGVRAAPCAHVESLDYCPESDVQHDDDPCEETLTRMVEQRRFGEAARKQCLTHRRRAESEGARLVGRVTLGVPRHKHYVSVYEPEPGRHSRTGRVLVSYDAEGKTWHCPRCKGASACLHRSVAKWCLFQTAGHLFAGPPVSGLEEEMPSQEEEEGGEGRGQQPEYQMETEDVGFIQFCLP